jgi:outer membrane receptor protein involved in Fe transport
VSVVDSQTISRGNMDLKPAYRDNFQLTYNWKLNVKKVTFNLSPQVFYEYKTGLIQTILSQNSDTKLFESVPTNISDGYEYGGALSVNSQIGKVLFNSNLRYSFYHVNKYNDQIDAMSRHGWNWNSFAMCPLPLNLQFMAMLNFSGPVLDGQTETRSSPMYLVGLGKQFKNNSVIRLMAYNPFARNFFEYQSTISNAALYQRQNIYLKKDYGFMLMYVYSFKLGKSIEREKRTVEQQAQDNLLKMPMTF